MDRETLKRNLKGQIIDALNLPGMAAEDISDDIALFGEGGLGLDSVDALELVVMLESKYGITIDGADEAKKIFANINGLADYVSERMK